MERETRLELANLHLGKVALYQLSYSRMKSAFGHVPCPSYLPPEVSRPDGASYLFQSLERGTAARRSFVLQPDSKGGGGDGTRTHSLRRATPALYQLSYSPVSMSNRIFFRRRRGVKQRVL